MFAYIEVEKGEMSRGGGRSFPLHLTSDKPGCCFCDTAVSIIPLQSRGNLFGQSKNGIRSQIEPTDQSWVQYTWGYIMHSCQRVHMCVCVCANLWVQRVCWTSDTSTPLDAKPHFTLHLSFGSPDEASLRDVSEGQEVMEIKAILTVPICEEMSRCNNS